MQETSVEQINAWLNVPTETRDLEFKEAKNTFSMDEVCEYCVAIANVGGGYLVLGVSNTPPRKVVGTKAFENLTKTVEKLSTKLKFHVDVEEVTHPNGRVVIFHIPSRPIGIAYRYNDIYKERVGSQLQTMSDSRLREIFSEGKPDWLEEGSMSGLDAQKVIDLLDTQTYFELFNLPYPSERRGVIERLENERLIRQSGGQYAITRLCALLFAKNLHDFHDIKRRAARVIVYQGNSKLETKLDQIGGKGYAVGFQGLIEFIMSQLPQNEVIEKALRKEIKLVPDIVIRELVANALIHQDFAVTGSYVTIEIYKDRVEISNPGAPVVSIERFIDGYGSRNEQLASLMRRMEICEEKGSGIDKVFDAVEVFQLAPPDFMQAEKRTIVKIFGYQPFEKMTRDDRVRACYQHACLKYVMNERATNRSLRERFKLSKNEEGSLGKNSVAVSQVIAFAVECGKIKRDPVDGGSKRSAQYLPHWA